MPIKLDMSKASDQVEWNYLEHIMQSMYIPSKFLALIVGCLCAVSYSVLINGVSSQSSLQEHKK